MPGMKRFTLLDDNINDTGKMSYGMQYVLCTSGLWCWSEVWDKFFKGSSALKDCENGIYHC